MDYAKKKKLKKFIKDFDQNLLGGLIRRSVRSPKKGEQSQEEEIITPEMRVAARAEVVRQAQQALPSDRELKRVEIIILKYKDPEVETICAKNLIENTQWPFKINFFDNRPGTKNMAKIWNKLIKESTCDYIALMDSDAFVPKMEPCWLTRCMGTFETHPDCYLVSPMLDNISFAQQRRSMAKNDPPEKMIEDFANTCMVFKKETMEKVGWYDEEFLFYGADPEWAWRFLHTPGVVGYLRPDVVVHHEWHFSAKKAAAKQEFNRVAEKEYANELYKKKTSSGAIDY